MQKQRAVEFKLHNTAHTHKKNISYAKTEQSSLTCEKRTVGGMASDIPERSADSNKQQPSLIPLSGSNDAIIF
jgi:hypothetical protein